MTLLIFLHNSATNVAVITNNSGDRCLILSPIGVRMRISLVPVQTRILSSPVLPGNPIEITTMFKA